MCEVLTEKLIGNTLEETAYHEAAHMVIAAAVGLNLRPGGITIWEAAEDVMDGLARYWKDEVDWGKKPTAAPRWSGGAMGKISRLVLLGEATR
jgi:hypothetical protein